MIDRFDHWLKHLLKIRDTTDYEEQRARIEGLANYIADLDAQSVELPCQCGAGRREITTSGDEVFLPRVGCLTCDQWDSLPAVRMDHR